MADNATSGSINVNKVLIYQIRSVLVCSLLDKPRVSTLAVNNVLKISGLVFGQRIDRTHALQLFTIYSAILGFAVFLHYVSNIK